MWRSSSAGPRPSFCRRRGKVLPAVIGNDDERRSATLVGHRERAAVRPGREASSATSSMGARWFAEAVGSGWGTFIAQKLHKIFGLDRGLECPPLTIKHITTYQYRQPVVFGEHRMMLRPRDGHDQSLIDAKLVIAPTPIRNSPDKDAFGNHVDIAHFAGRARELRFESNHSSRPLSWGPSRPRYRRVRLSHLSVRLWDGRAAGTGHLIKRRSVDPERRVERWARTFLRNDRPIDTSERQHRSSAWQRSRQLPLPSVSVSIGA